MHNAILRYNARQCRDEIVKHPPVRISKNTIDPRERSVTFKRSGVLKFEGSSFARKCHPRVHRTGCSTNRQESRDIYQGVFSSKLRDAFLSPLGELDSTMQFSSAIRIRDWCNETSPRKKRFVPLSCSLTLSFSHSVLTVLTPLALAASRSCFHKISGL